MKKVTTERMIIWFFSYRFFCVCEKTLSIAFCFIFRYYTATMAITKSAKTRIKSDANKRVFNLRRQRAMREQVKTFTNTVKSGDTKAAEAQIAELYKAIDKAAKRGVIKSNTASRKKSRLTNMLAKAA